MKNLITILIMLVALGCGKTETVISENPSDPREKLVGSYKWGETGKVHFLGNGKSELYINGKRTFEWKWMIVGNEVHLVGDLVAVCRIETNGDLTEVAEIEGGKRTDKKGMTLKKLKE